MDIFYPLKRRKNNRLPQECNKSFLLCFQDLLQYHDHCHWPILLHTFSLFTSFSLSTSPIQSNSRTISGLSNVRFRVPPVPRSSLRKLKGEMLRQFILCCDGSMVKGEAVALFENSHPLYKGRLNVGHLTKVIGCIGGFNKKKKKWMVRDEFRHHFAIAGGREKGGETGTTMPAVTEERIKGDEDNSKVVPKELPDLVRKYLNKIEPPIEPIPEENNSTSSATIIAAPTSSSSSTSSIDTPAITQSQLPQSQPKQPPKRLIPIASLSQFERDELLKQALRVVHAIGIVDGQKKMKGETNPASQITMAGAATVTTATTTGQAAKSDENNEQQKMLLPKPYFNKEFMHPLAITYSAHSLTSMQNPEKDVGKEESATALSSSTLTSSRIPRLSEMAIDYTPIVLSSLLLTPSNIQATKAKTINVTSAVNKTPRKPKDKETGKKKGGMVAAVKLGSQEQEDKRLQQRKMREQRRRKFDEMKEKKIGGENNCEVIDIPEEEESQKAVEEDEEQEREERGEEESELETSGLFSVMQEEQNRNRNITGGRDRERERESEGR